MGQDVSDKPFQSSHSRQTIACSIHSFLHFSSTRNLDNKKQSQTSTYKFVKKTQLRNYVTSSRRGISMPFSISCWDMKLACKVFKGIPKILMRYTKIIGQLLTICYNSIQSRAATIASFLVFISYAGILWLDEKNNEGLRQCPDTYLGPTLGNTTLLATRDSSHKLESTIFHPDSDTYMIYLIYSTLLILNSRIYSSKCSPRNKMKKPMQHTLENHDTQPRKRLMFKTSTTPMNLGLVQHKQQQGCPQEIRKEYSGIQMILVNDCMQMIRVSSIRQVLLQIKCIQD